MMIAGNLRSLIQTLLITGFLYIAMTYGASNRMNFKHVSRIQKKAQDQLTTHYREHLHDPIPTNYQSAQSDAMELYSIGAGKLVMVQKSGQVWDDDYELRAIKSNRKGGKRNKFVTETVTYGKLKIRSEENKMYICAKSSGQIVFKNKAERAGGAGKKKRTRRRCLFRWSFTEEKHIQLYIQSGGRDWYLAVQDNVVNLQPKERSSAKERSFIWLPTRSAHRPKKHRKYNTRASNSFSHARGFSLVRAGMSAERDTCDTLTKRVNQQTHAIHLISNDNNRLEDENKKLREELQRLKELQAPNSTNSTVSGVVHPTRRRQLMTSLVGDPR